MLAKRSRPPTRMRRSAVQFDHVRAYTTSVLAATVTLLTVLCTTSAGHELETIKGTIYCNNNISLYINGELSAVDPVPVAPHNAFNHTFEVEAGKDITFAVEAIDIADDETGLELNDRCLGAGGFRAFFSNGVVTDSSWKCYTYHYGPVNWKQCFAAEERPGALKVLPYCLFNVSEDDGFDSGCFSRTSPIPESVTVGPIRTSTTAVGNTLQNGTTSTCVPSCGLPIQKIVGIRTK